MIIGYEKIQHRSSLAISKCLHCAHGMRSLNMVRLTTPTKNEKMAFESVFPYTYSAYHSRKLEELVV